MPVMAPHFVANGDAPSISLSITWRSEWSYRESEAHAANAALRRMGFDPKMPPRWPSYAWAKTVGWRIARKFTRVSGFLVHAETRRRGEIVRAAKRLFSSTRSEERRVGKECVIRCSFGCTP